MATILIVDDNRAVATALDVLFSLHDIESVYADSPAAAMAILARHPIDLVVQDMNFHADTTSGEEGAELFAQIRVLAPDLPVILLTAWTNLEQAVQLTKAGAADYLAKPWDDRKLVASVRNLLELAQTQSQLRQRVAGERKRKSQLERDFDLCGMIWQDAATERVLSLACQVARSDVPVLISGPNGTGKERIAQIIQANSSVKRGAFVTLNCGALPAELIEAELFGADAGAYTGASKSREGKFSAADGGTLFLDEIGNLSAAGQMKLLRVLEAGKFERLGSNKEQHVKVRIISATNADLAAMIRAGQFREDLFYRLNVIEIALPPLAERRTDIIPLAQHFLGNEKTLKDDARSALLAHAWPGNVRELKNVIQRAALLTTGNLISAADLHLVVVKSPIDKSPTDEAEERHHVEQALARAGGVIAQAASDLGLSRQALYRRLERLGIART
jgi:DNA-binding NtrC family response regulator